MTQFVFVLLIFLSAPAFGATERFIPWYDCTYKHKGGGYEVTVYTQDPRRSTGWLVHVKEVDYEGKFTVARYDAVLSGDPRGSWDGWAHFSSASPSPDSMLYLQFYRSSGDRWPATLRFKFQNFQGEEYLTCQTLNHIDEPNPND